MSQSVVVTRVGEICLVRVDNPPVNALGQELRAGLLEAFDAAEADPAIRALVLLCAGKTFIAGADIKEFGKPPQPPLLPDLIGRLEGGRKPSVAVIHGSALGGGLELALGCHYRIARTDARLGLPEVRLGLLPGAGGTQRLPRLAGVAVALEMIVGGEPISAAEALQYGIVDELFDGDLESAGLAFARSLLARNAGPRRSGEQCAHLDTAVEPQALLEAKRLEVQQRMPGLYSPQRCIDAIEAAVCLPLAEGLRRERELFLQCMASPQRAALIHRFMAERRYARQLDDSGQVSAAAVGQRLAQRYRQELEQLAAEGVDAGQLDAALAAFDMAIGPLRVAAQDCVGQDTADNIDASNGTLVLGEGCLLERPLLALINEGTQLLAEAVVHRPADIDAILTKDFGFAPQRGGPMFCADQLGLGRVLEHIQYWQRRLGEHWAPAPLLQQLVADGRSFADLNGQN
ncbi:enoyl-CoA hydratase-related protein [Marinobacterium rhizophilum]|uniref:Enoyl-CoA hydratase/isomerase family protein n=1 Tax=Marinobacterium rhizophilum TaxID=420402 RepID=A0ABY5HGP3_9GAMM|nr:enoyl-CoA hydratase-related protein [Marinobacterium rhizophilum]UTW11455.1 enoyl-CoA hydratase/isomerase family protein [Marinobacterium rhizophilum]